MQQLLRKSAHRRSWLEIIFVFGKSSAMAISFRPISFHCERTTCDALGGGCGAALEACANISKVPSDTANASTGPAITFFIFSLLELFASARTSAQTTPFDESLAQTAFASETFPRFSGLA